MWTKVATTCCVCGISLTDSTSIEFGIGPVCRKKYRYQDAYPISAEQVVELSVWASQLPDELMGAVTAAAVANDSRKCANLLVYYASAEQGMEAVKAARAMRILGYKDLADRIEKRLVGVHLEKDGNGTVAVATPYSPDFVSGIRPIRDEATWDRENKRWLFRDRPEVADVLSRVLSSAFGGMTAIGPCGPFVL